MKFTGNYFFGKFLWAGLAALALILFPLDTIATHLRAGNITITRVSCTSNVFTITITAYTNENSPVKFSDKGVGVLDFGDGTSMHPPQQEGIHVPGFGPEFSYVIYSIQHTYGSGTFRVSYLEANRNQDILNMSNSVDTPFYIDTVISNDALGQCDNSPTLSVPPIDKACKGVVWKHNPGAYDIDFDSLSYVLVVPKQGRNQEVFHYGDPDSAVFYPGYFNTGNQAHNGPPDFYIQPDGTIIWDSPGAPGEYNIAFHVIEWRKINGVYTQIGYVTRDMQIIVEDCNNHPPVLSILTPDICITAGDTLVAQVTATDPDSNPILIEGFSRIFSGTNGVFAATLDAAGEVFQTTSPAKRTITWRTQCQDVAELPYQVVFKATDQPATSSTTLVDFSVMNIEVVGPAPKWTSLTPQTGHRAKLVWEPYTCSGSATVMQVWRRVESNPYTPPACVTGMPDFLGFTKIAEVGIGTSQYIDTNGGKGLPPGAEYCYRLVAVFKEPKGGLSYVSKENCFTSLADAPIITNVTIGVTDKTAGVDTVKWIAPLDIDAAVFPPPYSYSIFRGDGYTGPVTQIIPGKIDATFYIDNLNTDARPVNYRIIAYSGTTPIDTSSAASSVRLDLHPGVSNIELVWSAVVPWSNILGSSPLHTVYRGPAGSTKLSDLQEIGTVDVTKSGFVYYDSGQSDHVPLDKTKTYCYCVKTVGGYGNPKISEPLFNYSQISCAQPNDTIPPCKVTINAKGTNCSDVYKTTCSLTSFSNTLTWANPAQECIQDTYTYNIYAASQSGGEYTYKMNVSDTFFIDTNLSSFARCYRVSAVSRSGIEGPLSDPFCFDNCPYYEMPNVFTPGNDDNCNDLFSAYSDDPDVCPARSDEEIKMHCARFVNSVTFTVYNRWGKPVFNYQSQGENTIYVDWDGRDDGGKELSAGVYYYLAEVNFDVVDPSKRNKKIRGWVQIIR